MGNVWNFQYLYELQFFNCPACNYKDKSKQEFVDHACAVHPESITYLMNFSDINDVICPWNRIDIKEENIIDKYSAKKNEVTEKSDDERSVQNLEESDVEIVEVDTKYDIIESKKSLAKDKNLVLCCL